MAENQSLDLICDLEFFSIAKILNTSVQLHAQLKDYITVSIILNKFISFLYESPCLREYSLYVFFSYIPIQVSVLILLYQWRVLVDLSIT